MTNYYRIGCTLMLLLLSIFISYFHTEALLQERAEDDAVLANLHSMDATSSELLLTIAFWKQDSTNPLPAEEVRQQERTFETYLLQLDYLYLDRMNQTSERKAQYALLEESWIKFKKTISSSTPSLPHLQKNGETLRSAIQHLEAYYKAESYKHRNDTMMVVFLYSLAFIVICLLLIVFLIREIFG